MLKITGCVLIVSASIYIGVAYVNSMKKRIYSLSQMIELFTVLKIKLEYELCAIPELFRLIIKQEQGTYVCFLEHCISEIDAGASLKIAWNKSVDKFSREMNLSSNDTALLIDFSQALGDTDVSGQISNLEMYIELLHKNLKDAEKELTDKSRVSISCSLFLGLLVSILLI